MAGFRIPDIVGIAAQMSIGEEDNGTGDNRKIAGSVEDEGR
jgi:hypothetical protein